MTKYWIDVDGERVEVDVEWTGDAYRATIGDRSWDVRVADLPSTTSESETTDSVAPSPDSGNEADPARDEDVIYAPIAGAVSKLLVESGDRVEQGQTVMKLEAMKMQTDIAAGKDGVIDEVLVSQEERVEENQPLIRLRT